MHRKVIVILLILLALFNFVGCNQSQDSSDILSDSSQYIDDLGVIKIETNPKVANYRDLDVYKNTKSLPHGNYYENWGIDVRSCDVSSDDTIIDRLEDLKYTNFDSQTIWPKEMPIEFDPLKVMDLYKNPGLGVNKLHNEGIDGRGIGIAIIDQNLLVDHIEYKDRLKYYTECGTTKGDGSSMHGGAVASIAVGKTCGVAPNADLYFIANPFGTYTDDGFEYNYEFVADSIDEIIKVNETLPKNRKIRVISISLGFVKGEKGYEKFCDSVELAKENNIETIYVGKDSISYISFLGIGREPLTDGENFESYNPGLFWMKDTELRNIVDNYFYVPMDFRCTASPTGPEDYVVYINGGMSWTIPYVAGVYALACQVDPTIDLDRFFSIAYTTGRKIDSEFEYNGIKNYKLNIIDPCAIIDKLKTE